MTAADKPADAPERVWVTVNDRGAALMVYHQKAESALVCEAVNARPWIKNGPIRTVAYVPESALEAREVPRGTIA